MGKAKHLIVISEDAMVYEDLQTLRQLPSFVVEIIVNTAGLHKSCPVRGGVLHGGRLPSGFILPYGRWKSCLTGGAEPIRVWQIPAN